MKKWKCERVSHSVVFNSVTPWTVCSLLGCSVHGIFQTRILEWVWLSNPTTGSSFPFYRYDPAILLLGICTEKIIRAVSGDPPVRAWRVDSFRPGRRDFPQTHTPGSLKIREKSDRTERRVKVCPQPDRENPVGEQQPHMKSHSAFTKFPSPALASLRSPQRERGPGRRQKIGTQQGYVRSRDSAAKHKLHTLSCEHFWLLSASLKKIPFAD